MNCLYGILKMKYYKHLTRLCFTLNINKLSLLVYIPRSWDSKACRRNIALAIHTYRIGNRKFLEDLIIIYENYIRDTVFYLISDTNSYFCECLQRGFYTKYFAISIDTSRLIYKHKSIKNHNYFSSIVCNYFFPKRHKGQLQFVRSLIIIILHSLYQKPIAYCFNV